MAINKLVWAIRALAQTAENQLSLFPDFVNAADFERNEARTG